MASTLFKSRIIKPGAKIQDSFLFSHPSRVSDLWLPEVERVYLPGLEIPESEITIRVRKGETSPLEDLKSHFDSFYGSFRKKIKKVLLRARRKKSVESAILYDLRNSGPGNIAHLMHNGLDMYFCAKSILDKSEFRDSNIVVVIGKRPSRITVNILELFKIPYLLSDNILCGNILEVNKKYQFSLILEFAQQEIPNYIEETPTKIFIPRKDSRQISNEAEVEAFLVSRGFKKYYFDEIPLNMQWSLMCNATDIVATHGAALGSLVFNSQRKGGSRLNVTELFSPGLVVKPFRKYTGYLNGSWSAVRGKVTPDVIRDLDFAKRYFNHAYRPFEVSIEALELALEQHRFTGDSSRQGIGDKSS